MVDFAIFQSDLPELENETSEKLRAFINYLNDQRPYPAAFNVIRYEPDTINKIINHY